jgi:hypothetical protein
MSSGMLTGCVLPPVLFGAATAVAVSLLVHAIL